MAKYYAVNLALENKRCVVIGGGKVAERKVRCLLECGARILVVSPVISRGLKAMADKARITFKRGKVKLRDLAGAHLVIAATTDRAVNFRVSSYCRSKNILINVVDSPKECSFILPSIIRRGDLAMTISTDGISPALSKKLRQDIEKRFGAEYAGYLRLMKKIRPRALKKIKSSRSKRAFFKKALQSGIFSLLKRGKTKQASTRLENILNNASKHLS